MTENERQGMFVTLEQRVEISKCFAELDEYKAIGTIEEFKALKERSVAKKALPNIVAGKVICPTCNSSHFKTYEHCVKCGQKLDC